MTRRWPLLYLLPGLLVMTIPLGGAKGCGGVIVPPGPPAPPPPPTVECLPGIPWCHETALHQDCGACKHNPTADPDYCERAPANPACPPPPAPPVPPPPVPPSPPPGSGCSIDGEPGAILPDHRPILGSQVNAAMVALRPDCDPGGRCVLEESRQEWQARVIAEVRRRGVCSGQHEPTSDEIAAASSVTAPREGWHVYAGPWAGPGTVVWSPQAARPAYAAPSGPPPPMPPPGDCPPPLPDRTRLYLDLVCGGSWCGATVQTVGTLGYCEAGGMSPMADGTLRASCPMRSECPGYQCEARVACELYAMGGAYKWESFPAWQAIIPHPSNPALASCEGCDRLRVCSADEAVCSDWVKP